MSDDNWYSIGADNFDKEDKKNRPSSSGRGEIFRYFIGKNKGGEQQKVLLLEDEPFNVYMHQWEQNGHWGNWASCPMRNGSISDWCPLCEKQQSKDSKVSGRMIGHFTVVDMTGYEKDDQHIMPIEILPANNELVELLDIRRKQNESIANSIFSVTRTKGKGSRSLGNDWTFGKKVDPEKFLKKFFKDLSPSLNYFPKEWGFWTGDEDNVESRTDYVLKGLPFDIILKPEPAETLADRLNLGNASFDTASYDSFDDDKSEDDDLSDVDY